MTVAANRGVVAAGPYGLVRHPMYAGYLLVYLGFSLINPTAWNALVYAIATGAMIVRVLAEEKAPARDPAYAAFVAKVRWRLAPGLF